MNKTLCTNPGCIEVATRACDLCGEPLCKECYKAGGGECDDRKEGEDES